MKKQFVMAFLLSFPVAMSATETPTPSVVVTFYQTMKDMSDATSDSQSFYYRNLIEGCFRGKENSGIPVPNDFYDWGYSGYSVPANAYASRVEALFYKEKKVKLEKYSVRESCYIYEVDLKPYPSGLVQTIVHKTLSDGNVTAPFADTLIVEENEIVIFRNARYSNDDVVDIATLRTLASSYYTSGEHYKAYKIYEKIISIDHKNANAYYRLGLMTFWRQGCSFSKKEAHRRGLEYAKKSKDLGFSKADVAIYYMKHHNN